jgi:hypothetical protein
MVISCPLLLVCCRYIGPRLGKLLVEVIFQSVERGVPVAGERGQKPLRHLHRRRVQSVAHAAPLPRFCRH